MKTQIGWTAFLISLSAFTLAPTGAQATTGNSPTAVEARLARLSATLQAKAAQLPPSSPHSANADLLAGWANGGGGRGFVNTRRGGWGDGTGGRGFVNVNPWRNGWADGGGFWNRPWGNGSFINRW
jgi:rSAM-associated Gly-rich repeat protein